MAVDWGRVAWTVAFALIALLAFMVYMEFSGRYKEKYANLRTPSDLARGVKRVEGAVKRPQTTAYRRTRRSRKYRRRR